MPSRVTHTTSGQSCTRHRPNKVNGQLAAQKQHPSSLFLSFSLPVACSQGYSTLTSIGTGGLLDQRVAIFHRNSKPSPFVAGQDKDTRKHLSLPTSPQQPLLLGPFPEQDKRWESGCSAHVLVWILCPHPRTERGVAGQMTQVQILGPYIKPHTVASVGNAGVLEDKWGLETGEYP